MESSKSDFYKGKNSPFETGTPVSKAEIKRDSFHLFYEENLPVCGDLTWVTLKDKFQTKDQLIGHGLSNWR